MRNYMGVTPSRIMGILLAGFGVSILSVYTNYQILFIGVGLCVVFFMLYFYKNILDVSFVLITWLLSIQSYSIKLFGISLKPSELFFAIGIVAMFLSVCAKLKHSDNKLSGFYFWPLAVFIIYVIINFFLTPIPPNLGAINAIGKNSPALRSAFTIVWTVFNVAMVWFMGKYLTSYQKIYNAIAILIRSTTVICIMSVFAYILKLAIPHIHIMLIGPWRVPRLQAFAYEADYFANFLICVLPFTLYFVISGIGNKRHMLWLSAIQILSLILTFSTAGWAAMTAALIVMLFISMRARIPWRRVFGIAITGIVGIAVIYWISPHLLSSVVHKPLDSERLYGRLVAWNLFIRHPMHGVGLGNSDLYVVINNEMVTVNNLYYQLLSDTGLIGVTIIAMSFGFLMFGLKRVLKHGGNVSKFVPPMVGCIAGFLVQFVTISTLNIVYVWYIIGLAVSMISVSRLTRGNNDAKTGGAFNENSSGCANG